MDHESYQWQKKGKTTTALGSFFKIVKTSVTSTESQREAIDMELSTYVQLVKLDKNNKKNPLKW